MTLVAYLFYYHYPLLVSISDCFSFGISGLWSLHINSSLGVGVANCLQPVVARVHRYRCLPRYVRVPNQAYQIADHTEAPLRADTAL